MDQLFPVAFTALADVWPMAIETEIGAALCAIGAGRILIFLTRTLTFRYIRKQFQNMGLNRPKSKEIARKS